jgi:peptidyl-prolyl cis-trans isomerase D
MLQNLGDILKGRRWLALLVLVPLAVIFAVWGAAGLTTFFQTQASYGLKVNGEEVPVAKLQEAWQQRQSQYQQQLHAELPPDLRARLQAQLIDQYVRESLLRQRAQKAGFRASDSAVEQAYVGETAFQVNGKFDPMAARGMLAQIGLTPEAYESQLRNSLQVGQLEQSVELGDFLTQPEMQRAFALENERREVRYALLPAAAFQAAAKVDEAALRAWYTAHLADYQSRESVRLQYAELRLDSMAGAVKVNDADLAAWYAQNKGRYVEAEKRHARHILITIGGKKEAADDAAALAKAQSVLKELRAGGDFAALARKYSQDPGSARQGGDLGWALKGAYVPAFSDRLYAMKAGETSDPVKTQYGYHIIHLDAVQAERAKTIADSRAQIEGDYKREHATDAYGDVQERLQQKLESSATGGDIAALATEFGMTVGEVGEFTRTGGGNLGTNADLIGLVFSDGVLKDHRIGGPVGLGEDRIVIVKALEHRSPQAKPFAEVRSDVEAAVRREEGGKAAREAAQAAVKRLVAGGSFDAIAKELKATPTAAAFIDRGDPQPPAQVRDAAFAATVPAPGKPVYEAIAMDQGGAAILALLSVKAGEAGANAANDQQLLRRYNERHRAAEFQAYLAEMQRRADVQRNPNVFN